MPYELLILGVPAAAILGAAILLFLLLRSDSTGSRVSSVRWAYGAMSVSLDPEADATDEAEEHH